VEGVENSYFFDKSEIEFGSGEITFDLANEALWAFGTNKVNIYLNRELDQSLDFTVQ
jgi:hypothetical protein